MRTNSIVVALGICALMLVSAVAPAQSHRKARRHVTRTRHTVARKSSGSVSGAETGLAGIKLYDSGSRIVAVYGSPDSIEAVTFGSNVAGPGGGPAGGAGGRGLPGVVGGVRGGAGGGAAATAQMQRPGGPSDFGFGDNILGGDPDPAIQDRQGIPAPQGPPGGAPQGPPGSLKGGAGVPMGGAGSPGTFGSSDRVTYTRWVYNRNASKFGFILDKFNRVVQCEAIGIQAGKARTRRGITFGSSFAQIIKKYGAPDGYEIGGDNNVVVRYLSKDKCAFRLSRLGENKPHVVTGIVVAAGKR